MAYMGAHQGAQAADNAKVIDETGIGDKAFSSTASFGAFFVVLKHGRVLQIQYWTGGLGTSQDVGGPAAGRSESRRRFLNVRVRARRPGE